MSEGKAGRQRGQHDFFMQLFMGGGDGLILVFFVATALVSVQAGRIALITICTLIVVLSGIIMGFSGYIASLIEKNHLKAVLQNEVQLEKIRKETQLLDYLEIDKRLQKMAFEEMEKDRQHWAGLMHDIDTRPHNRPGYSLASAFNTGFAYMTGGILPLLPYYFAEPGMALKYSLIISALALVFFGYLKSFYTSVHALLSIFNLLLAALLAGAGAFAVGKVFTLSIGLIPLYLRGV